MSSLSNVEAKLPPGFRFHPKDEELIYDYLIKWIMGCPLQSPLLIEVDLNKCEPWDIPKTACVGGKEWYFFSQKDKKYATGLRTNRATASGYWKATGKDRPIVKSGALIGMRKTLVFYLGRAPKGSKTDWVMHEFRVEGPEISSNHVKDQDWVLCRVFCKNIQQSSPPSSDQTTHSKQENPNPNLDFVSSPSSSSRPSLTELPNHYNIRFVQQDNSVATYHHGQLPCFSTHTMPNQTSPYHNFSLNMNPTSETLSNFGDHPEMLCYDHRMSSCDGEGDGDKKVIAEVLNHLTRKDLILNNNHRDDNNISLIKSAPSCSPSFVDQSSESFLSELGFSSVWNNQYS